MICICTTIAIIYPGCGLREEPSGVNALPAETKQDLKMKPYRVLIVIGNQWKDPMSYHIDPDRVEGTDFLDVVNMLKIWGVPFDILRLDEQKLQINRFLDGVAQPYYGCIIWMADPGKLTGYSTHYQTLSRVVNEYGISMIALFDHIRNQEIASLVGVDYKGIHTMRPVSTTTKFTISGDHYITEGAVDVRLPDRKYLADSSIPAANGITTNEPGTGEDTTLLTVIDCIAGESVTVLGSVGSTPQLTVKDVDQDTKVIWIGGGRDCFRKYQLMRKIFRKSCSG